MKDVDTLQKPYAVFFLKYRSRKDLEDMMIVPRPSISAPPPLDADNDDVAAAAFASLARDEILRLAWEKFEEQRVNHVSVRSFHEMC